MDLTTLAVMPAEYLPIALIGVIIYQILKLVLPYYRKRTDEPEDSNKTDALG